MNRGVTPSFNGHYLVLVHPSMLEQMKPTPRERWKMRYREERMRAKSYPEKTINPVVAVSVGCFEGVRVVGERVRK